MIFEVATPSASVMEVGPFVITGASLTSVTVTATASVPIRGVDSSSVTVTVTL